MSESFVESIPDHLQSLVTRLDLYARTQHGHSYRIEDDELFPSLEAKDFRLKRILGRGGMGTVYIAEQISLERQVAVKVLASSLVKNDADRAQFEREAKLIAVLHHPGIIKILSAGEVNGRCFYAMELVDGPSLDKVTFTSLQHLATIGVKIANALAYAHQCNVLHRDIKPANIFLDQHEEIHLGDFGIAYSIHGHHVVFDAEGTPSGTPEYIAPERLSRGENTIRSDIYSFGVTLRELARKSTLKLDYDFNAIIAMCVHEEPSKRYATIADVAKDLHHYIVHRPVLASHPSILKKTYLWVRRNPIYGVLLGLLLLGSIGGGIQTSIDYAQLLNARRELSQLSIPEQRDYNEHKDIELRRTLELAERILGRYPEDPEIVEKTLSLYDDYMDLHRHGKRSMLTALQETDRIISTLSILFWNPNISDAIQEQLIEMQLRRLEFSIAWRNTEDSQWLQEKIKSELEYYKGSQRDAFQHRLNQILANPKPQPLPRNTPRHGGQRLERNSSQRTNGKHHNQRFPSKRISQETPPTDASEQLHP